MSDEANPPLSGRPGWVIRMGDGLLIVGLGYMLVFYGFVWYDRFRGGFLNLASGHFTAYDAPMRKIWYVVVAYVLGYAFIVRRRVNAICLQERV
jgi:hypothetical protein